MRRVRVTGHPRQYGELAHLVGRVGMVREVRERPEGRGNVLRVLGLPGGGVWLAEGYCEEVPEEAEGVA